MTRIYKIVARAEWERARTAGRYLGSAIDRADGFIHLSTAAQAQETAARHFRGVADLVVLALDARALDAAAPGALRWETSRGGAPFPHLYAPLDAAAVIAVTPAPLDAAEIPQLGDLDG